MAPEPPPKPEEKNIDQITLLGHHFGEGGNVFRGIAEAESLSEILKEAESRGYRPVGFYQTYHNYNLRQITSGYLSCQCNLREGIITSESLTNRIGRIWRFYVLD